MTPAQQELIVNRLVEALGHTTQSLGVGRVLGQVFAYLYLTPEAQSLDDLTAALGISKGSASMGVRQLEQWGALEKVWIKGDRKDYYRARDTLGKILKNAILDLAGKRIGDAAALLDEVETSLQHNALNGESATEQFLRERLAKVRAFQGKAQYMWDGPFIRMLLK